MLPTNIFNEIAIMASKYFNLSFNVIIRKKKKVALNLGKNANKKLRFWFWLCWCRGW